MVDRITLQAADIHGVVYQGPTARVLAGMLAHVRAGRRKRVVLPNKLDRIVEAARSR